jgi:hypothetical protein
LAASAIALLNSGSPKPMNSVRPGLGAGMRRSASSVLTEGSCVTAARRISQQFAELGGQARVRMVGGQPLLTDNGQILLDVTGLDIVDPLAFETLVSQWPGVVTVGVFAHQKAQVCLLGTTSGVRTLAFDDGSLKT